MGYFLVVSAGVIKKQDNGFVQTNELIHFNEKTYISWMQPLVTSSADGWIGIADNTLHIEEDNDRQDMRIRRTITSPIFQDKESQVAVYRDDIELGFAYSLYHIVLPPYYLPASGQVFPLPSYALVHKDRLVIGWMNAREIHPRFSLEQVEPEEYGERALKVQQSIALIPRNDQDYAAQEMNAEFFQSNARFLETQTNSYLMQVASEASLNNIKDKVRGLAHLLVGITSGSASLECLKEFLTVNSDIWPLIDALNGVRFSMENYMVGFGSNNQFGDVSIRDIVQGNQYNIVISTAKTD